MQCDVIQCMPHDTVAQVELENERLTSKVLQLEKNASNMRDNLSDSLMGKDELNSQIQGIKSTEREAKSRVNF